MIGVAIGLSVAGVTVLTTALHRRAARGPPCRTTSRARRSRRSRAAARSARVSTPSSRRRSSPRTGSPPGFDVAITRSSRQPQGRRSLGAEQLRRPDRRLAGRQVRLRAVGNHAGASARSRSPFAKPTLAAAEGIVVQKSSTKTTIAALNTPKVKFCDQTGTGSQTDQLKYFPKTKAVLVPSASGLPAPDALREGRRHDLGQRHRKRLAQGPPPLKLVVTNEGLPAAPVSAGRAARGPGVRGIPQRLLRRMDQQRRLPAAFEKDMGYAPDMEQLYNASGGTSDPAGRPARGGRCEPSGPARLRPRRRDM